jgi:hypothetical protein
MWLGLLTRCSKEPLPDKPIKAAWTGSITIPTRPKKDPEPAPNGNGASHGKHGLDEDTAAAGSVKRQRQEDQTEAVPTKMVRLSPDEDDVVVLDDNVGRAIVIDDD